MYSFQRSRSLKSVFENFQRLIGSSMRLRKRRFCSPFDTCRKNFRMIVPLRLAYRSKLLMSSKRSFQICLVTSDGGNSLGRQNLGVHADDQDFFVVRAVEHANPATFRHPPGRPPQKVVVELLVCRRLERIDLGTLRVHARHDVLDRAVLAGRVHGLEDEQQRPAVLRVEQFLKLAEPFDASLSEAPPHAASGHAGRRRPVFTSLRRKPRSVRHEIAIDESSSDLFRVAHEGPGHCRPSAVAVRPG